jgi:acetyl esterase/lipase
MTSFKHLALASVSLAALGGFVLVAQPREAAAQAQQQHASSSEHSGTMERADKDMARVIKKLMDLGAKPIGTQSVEETRKGPTPADAVKAVLKDEGKDPSAVMAQMKVKKQDMTYPTGGGTQAVRIYTPEGQVPQGGFPVIVYYHGGGWVIADIDTYEASAMALAHKVNAIVASVEYRHAPENKFPAQHEDANAAYKWVLDNAGQWNGNPRRIAVAGESAGGNLAVNVAIAARDQNMQMPAYVVSVYPIAGTDTNTPSYQKNANAVPLSKPAMEWFFKNTVSKPEDMQDPRLDLVGKANLKGLPPTLVITDEIDPLMSEGSTLASKLKQAGVETKHQNFEGATHEFFSMGAVVKDGERAEDLAAKELKDALASAANSTSSTSHPTGNEQPRR